MQEFGLFFSMFILSLPLEYYHGEYTNLYGIIKSGAGEVKPKRLS